MIRARRLVEPVRVPAALAEQLRDDARRRGVDPGQLAGDLVARELVAVVIEVVAAALAESADRPALPPGGAL